MLRRRFMMQQSASGFKYSCKFELEYGGQTNQYMLYKGGLSVPPDEAYGIGFTIICDDTITANTLSGSMGYGTFTQGSVLIDNLEIKITKPDLSKVRYNIPLKFAYTPSSYGGESITYDAIGGSFVFVDRTTEHSGRIATQYTWIASPPMSESSTMVPTIRTGIAYADGYNTLSELVDGLQQGTYTFELIYTSNINLLEYGNKLYVCNTGSIYSYTQSKSTNYNSCASLCKKQFLQTDGVFVDNMYKSNGSI